MRNFYVVYFRHLFFLTLFCFCFLFNNILSAQENNFVLRINAGGPEITYNGELFSADQNFVGGTMYVNNSAQVPDLYKTERSSPSQIFSYEIPLQNGDYTVNLHFAEIYWGATGGGAGGVGKRIFDVSIEGSLVLDNYDINADVGPQTVVTKSFPVTVSDGQLNIDFSALASIGGVDQPKVSGIEVIGNTLSINDSSLDKINIYTNYTEKTIVVIGHLEAHTNFELYDIQGRLVHTTKLNTDSLKQTLDVSRFASGIYVVKLKNNSQLKTQKIILK